MRNPWFKPFTLKNEELKFIILSILRFSKFSSKRNSKLNKQSRVPVNFWILTILVLQKYTHMYVLHAIYICMSRYRDCIWIEKIEPNGGHLLIELSNGLLSLLILQTCASIFLFCILVTFSASKIYMRCSSLHLILRTHVEDYIWIGKIV